MEKLSYLLHSGKNSRLKYYLKNYAAYIVPRSYYRSALERTLAEIDTRDDKDYIYSRVEYYNRLTPQTHDLPQSCPTLGEQRLSTRTYQKAYFFDSYEYTRWFDTSLRWSYLFGDVITVPELPSIVKSRPIADDLSNANSVVLNLDKNRHFTFLDDTLDFEKKLDLTIFRGHINNKQNRIDFVRKFIDNPRFDVGEMTGNPKFPYSWHKPKISLYDHLRYKFIMALEGRDVASNLKWIMSSNSLAVMPRPKYETWFMEGTLKPDYHYVEVREDYADVEEKMDYYIAHPDMARRITENANRYIEQFLDSHREDLISLAVLEKYFNTVG